jgi:hypothetical protein
VLLARAVADEAGVLFVSISGSEFVEMFVKRHGPGVVACKCPWNFLYSEGMSIMVVSQWRTR